MPNHGCVWKEVKDLAFLIHAIIAVVMVMLRQCEIMKVFYVMPSKSCLFCMRKYDRTRLLHIMPFEMDFLKGMKEPTSCMSCHYGCSLQQLCTDSVKTTKLSLVMSL